MSAPVRTMPPRAATAPRRSPAVPARRSPRRLRLVLPLKDSGGIYSYTRGINWVAVGVWVLGALASYVLTYAYPSPIGATIPSFASSFVLYLALSWSSREKFARTEHAHLSEGIRGD